MRGKYIVGEHPHSDLPSCQAAELFLWQTSMANNEVSNSLLQSAKRPSLAIDFRTLRILLDKNATR